ncbi:PAS domain S-box-containing protein [Pseudarcicella hirudinis]|uniref:histidine kinase n=1 Tax=Pseudarcicella hirudinis TaxID=1079859 RepID=A0A1I5WBL2_9BACT|nr:response regulator [Pseudarcicella hirudinis]SFQ17069.1 PAS domain S-box-containing protein [Pseudarcicella hirudinis]
MENTDSLKWDNHKERKARLQAESIMEEKTLELFEANQNLLFLNKSLEEEIIKRTKELKNSEEKYRGIVENLELGLLEVDNKGLIVKANDRFCSMSGYEVSELLGKNAMEMLVPKEFQEVLLQQSEDRKTGQAGTYEIQLIKKYGDRIWVLISGAAIFDEFGKISGSVGIHYDITDHKVLELGIERATILAEEARNAEKQFLANMSHEIRTPLNAIIGMVHLLYDTQPSTQQLEYIEILKTSSDFLHDLISDLLDIAKIEAGRVEIQDKEFDLVGFLRTIQKVFEIKLGKKPIEVQFMIDTRIESNVIGDELLLNQILLNILGNAEKFTEKGKITLSVTVLKDDVKYYILEFQISDTGIGIPKDKIDLIFQKFKQINPQGQKYKGTGLGLAITKQLVELQGGKISVNSRENLGTTFIFTIRYTKGGVESLVKNNPLFVPERNLDNGHVLVVEDNLMNQKYIGSLLNKWDVRHTIVSDGKMALEKIQEERFDIILMDIQMPHMNGYETTIAIRSTQNPNQHIPIIALTASAMLDQKNKALEIGMNDFLTKPFNPGQLHDLLERFSKIPINDAEADLDFLFSTKLDRNRLIELYGDDIEYAAEMFETFLNDVLPDFDLLSELLEKKEFMLFGRMVHKLKPSIVMVGLTYLEEKMHKLESFAKNESDWGKIGDLLHSLMSELENMLPVIKEEYGKLNALMD